jgi:thiamine biosynthesis lipoprotein ApbE
VIDIQTNQMGRPGAWIDLPARKGYGVDTLQDLLDFGVERKVIELQGASYYFRGERLAVGKERVKDLLYMEPGLAREIAADIMRRT